MTTARCPACHAAVPAGADWCGLCFADLRPKPAVAVAERPAVVAEPAVSPSPSPGAAVGVSLGVAGPSPSVLDTGLDAPVMKHADVRLADPTWPCASCGASAPIDADRCPSCGAGFLGGPVATVALDLPLVGNVGALSGGQKWAFALGAGAVLSLVLWGLFALVGAFL